MKTFSILFAAAGLAMASTAFAQAQDLALRTRAVSDGLSRSTPMDIYVTSANQSNVQFKTDLEMTTTTVLPMAQFKFFYMFEPDDFLSAKESYQNGQYREARAKFAKVKSNLAPIMGLNDGYFQAAALFELDSALAMLDWASVKELMVAFPKQSPLTEEMKKDMEIYALFAKLADKAYDDILTSGKTLMAGRDKLSLDHLTKLHYVLGVASAEKNQADEALDRYASALVASHGGNRELAASAILNSIDLYLKNKKVAELQKKVNMGEGGSVNPASVAQEVKDAAALAYLYKNVLFPDRVLNPKFDWLLKFYVAPAAKGKAPDSLMKQPEKKDAAAPAPAAKK